jgi:hypothetical protein
MQASINQSYFEKQTASSLLLVLGMLVFIGLACGSKTPPPPQYVGVWSGEDGTLITIRGDGSGDYKSGGSSVSGGSVTIDEAAKTLKVTLATMGPSYTIDKPPSGNQMTLSGVVFRKGGGSDTKSDTKPDKTASPKPSESPDDDN